MIHSSCKQLATGKYNGVTPLEFDLILRIVRHKLNRNWLDCVNHTLERNLY